MAGERRVNRRGTVTVIASRLYPYKKQRPSETPVLRREQVERGLPLAEDKESILNPATGKPYSALERAGFVRLPGTARRHKGPDDKVVSYRTAFKKATGRSLEEAVHGTSYTSSGRATGHNDKYPEYHDAKQIREAARDGVLSEKGILTVRQEQAVAEKTLKQLMKGHFYSEATKAGQRAKREGKPELGPERRSIIGRIFEILQEQPPSRPRPEDYPSGPEGDRIYNRAVKHYDVEKNRINGPRSKKAAILVAMGRRDPDAEYSVGDTPDAAKRGGWRR